MTFEADSLRNFEVDEREGNRKAEATLENAVEVAVFGIAVGLAVPAETAFLEKLVADRVRECLIPRAFSRARTDRLGDQIELARKGVRVDGIAAEAGDRDGSAEQIDIVIAAGDRQREVALGRVLHNLPA